VEQEKPKGNRLLKSRPRNKGQA